MILHIKVKPNSPNQEIKQISSTQYHVSLKSPAEDNKANIELLKILKKHFKAKEAKLKSGFTSRNKTVEIKHS